MTIDLAAWASWGYLAILTLVLADAVVPLVPSETLLLAGGVLAADGELVLAGVVGAAAAGAFLGDHLSYHLGRAVGPRLLGRMRSRRGRRAVIWSAHRIERHGIPLLISARFLPGGRTASTLTAGLVRFPRLRFALGAGVGATLWAISQTLIGFAGGRVTTNPVVGLVLATLFALAFGAAAHVAFRYVTPGWREDQALSQQSVDRDGHEEQREVSV